MANGDGKQTGEPAAGEPDSALGQRVERFVRSSFPTFAPLVKRPAEAVAKRFGRFFRAFNFNYHDPHAFSRWLFDDKLIIEGLLKANGLPVAETRWTVTGDRAFDHATHREHPLAAIVEELLDSRHFCKPRNGESGAGTFIIDGGLLFDGSGAGRPIDAAALQARFASAGTMLLQDVIAQHPALDVIHAGSLNTVRGLSYLDRRGTARMVGATLRLGVAEAIVDNASAGGLFCGIDLDSGGLMAHAYDKSGKAFARHPTSGWPFDGTGIPGLDAAFAICIRGHELLGRPSTIGWDVAIGPDGPVVLEANTLWMALLHAKVDRYVGARLWRAFLDDYEGVDLGFAAPGLARLSIARNAQLAVFADIQAVEPSRELASRIARGVRRRGFTGTLATLPDGSLHLRLEGAARRLETFLFAIATGEHGAWPGARVTVKSAEILAPDGFTVSRPPADPPPPSPARPASRGDGMPLTAADLARITGGRWQGLDDPGRRFLGLRRLERARAGEIGLAFDGSSRWPGREAMPSTAREMQAAAETGVAAFLVAGAAVAPALDRPVLTVESTWDALAQIAAANRDATTARRILVTGSVGKTTYKGMTAHILADQCRIAAATDSANLNAPIWESLASIGATDDIAIIEASVANPGRGRERSAIILPHICVLTHINESHTAYHGSLANLIVAKAEAVISLAPDGVCLMGADHAHYPALRQAVETLRQVPILTWGREPWCDAVLEMARYESDRSRWIVHARITGRLHDYTIATHHSFVPVASLASLLTAQCLGLDVAAAAARFADFKAGETAGQIREVAFGDGHITLFDYSQRGSIAAFRNAFADLYRLAPPDARIVMALGESRDLAPDDHVRVHHEIANLIQPARTTHLFTVGDGMTLVRRELGDAPFLAAHGAKPADIRGPLFDAIQPGDVVFIQGHHRVWLEHLVRELLGGRGVDAGSGPHPALLRSRLRRLARGDTSAATSVLAFGGDVCLARDLPGLVVERGDRTALGDVAEVMRETDGACVNLECVLSDRGDFWPKGRERRPYHFNTPPAMAAILAQAGIRAVTTANNHAMDFGPEALRQQADILMARGIYPFGSGVDEAQARRWRILDCGGVAVALIGVDLTAPYAAATADQPGIFHLSSESAAETLEALVAEARGEAQVVIVSPHWGANWQEAPSPEIRALAHRLIDAGADAVLGHSAHILQGVECYRGRAIAYDMGTLLFDRVRQARMSESALFLLDLSARGVHRLRLQPVFVRRSTTRLAVAAAPRIAQRILDLSRELDPASMARIDDRGQVCFELEPDDAPRDVTGGRRRPRRGSQSPSLDDAAAILTLPIDGTSTLIASDLPADLSPVDLGAGLQIAATRFPDSVAPEYGFLLETVFRCTRPLDRRWRAELRFVPASGKALSCRYPVAGGFWHDRAGSAHWLSDRLVVRTPAGAGEGDYMLYWTLWSRDAAGAVLFWPLEGAEGARSWARLGRLSITRTAPRRVAGLLPSERPVFVAVEAAALPPEPARTTGRRKDAPGPQP
ncbi:MAG: CapA family protein [Azospirillaceae bacterium]